MPIQRAKPIAADIPVINSSSIPVINTSSLPTIPNTKFPVGGIVQMVSRVNVNTSFTTSSTSMTDIDGFYVDITPVYTNSIIVWECTHTSTLNDDDGYCRFRVVDSNNSDTVFSSNTYCGHAHYYNEADHWDEIPIRARGEPGTTNTMRLQLQLQINSGGTFSMNWSGSDHRVISATEYRQV